MKQWEIMMNNDVVLTIPRPMRKRLTWATDTYTLVNKHEVSIGHTQKTGFASSFLLMKAAL